MIVSTPHHAMKGVLICKASFLNETFEGLTSWQLVIHKFLTSILLKVFLVYALYGGSVSVFML